MESYNELSVILPAVIIIFCVGLFDKTSILTFEIHDWKIPNDIFSTRTIVCK